MKQFFRSSGAASSRKLSVFCAASLVFIFISAVAVFSGQRGMESFVFRDCEDFFADTFNIYVYLDSQNIYTGDAPFTRGYYGYGIPRFYRNNPPMVFLHFDILRRLLRVRNMHLFLAVYVSLLLGAAFFYLLYRKLRGSEAWKVLFCGSILLSGVFIGSLERGNIIMLAVCYVTFYLFAWKSENPVLRELALIALAMATALKVYPGILGVLLVFDRRWSECARLFVYGVLLSFAPFLWFPGGFELIPDLLFNVLSPSSLVQPPCLLFSAWIPVLGKILPEATAQEIGNGLYSLGILIGILSCVAAFFDRRKWRRTTLIVLALLLIPKIGGAYNLLYLIPCLVLFVNDPEEKGKDLWTAFLFALVLSPPLLPPSCFGIPIPPLNELSTDLLVITLLRTSAGDSFRKRGHDRTHENIRAISGAAVS